MSEQGQNEMNGWQLQRHEQMDAPVGGVRGLGQCGGVKAGTPPLYGEGGGGLPSAPGGLTLGGSWTWALADPRPSTSGFHSGPSLASWPHRLPPPALPLAYRGWTCLSSWARGSSSSETRQERPVVRVEPGNYPNEGTAWGKHRREGGADGSRALSAAAGTAPGHGANKCGHRRMHLPP